MTNQDLTKGNVTKSLLVFAAPMILGNLLQQCYNIADTWVGGKFVGADDHILIVDDFLARTRWRRSAHPTR